MHPQLLCIGWRRKLPMAEAELSDGRDPRPDQLMVDHIMHPQFGCNITRRQRLIPKSGYRVLEWPPTDT